MNNLAQSLTGLLLLVACGEEAASPSITTRQADSAECQNGGTVLLIDDEASGTVCNGITGVNGRDGMVGNPGANGAADTPASGGFIQDVRLCEWTDGSMELAVYVWILTPGDQVVGMCRFVSANNPETVELAEASCASSIYPEQPTSVLVSPNFDSITISGNTEDSSECLSVN